MQHKIKQKDLNNYQWREFALGSGHEIGCTVFIRFTDEDGIYELPFEVVDNDYDGETL